ncbi:nose resistant to fluoxetine protein 6-like [Dermacentor variabilis]|uniref:nose resistant to fluoxetine protein 6-like n=1 Tax=Dermacentor variabilis TaxID=34621 RepID=UPI003F5C56A9
MLLIATLSKSFSSMVFQQSARRDGRRPHSALWVLMSSFVLMPFLTHTSRAQNAKIATGKSESAGVTLRSPDKSVGKIEEVDYVQVARDVVTAGFSKVPPSLIRKLLEADVRPECSTALLRTMRAFQNLEPWALRLFDASGRFPTGIFEAARVDMGGFDECLQTVLRDQYGNVLSRGQYCNLLVYIKNWTALEVPNSIAEAFHPKLRYFSEYIITPGDPIARLGVCYIDDCNQNDLHLLANSVSLPLIHLEISNCVTAEPKSWSNIQIGIVIFAAIVLIFVITGTLVDHFAKQQCERKNRCGVLFQVVVAFSAESNTRMLLNAADKKQFDQQSLQFLHGMRLFCNVHVVVAHAFMITSDSFSGMLNMFNGTSEWQSMIMATGFNTIDTFLFMSGFLLCHTLKKYNISGPAVFIIVILRRLIRICVPLFFTLMWFYLLPHFVTGPNTDTFFQHFYDEMAQHWWHLIVHIKNLFEVTIHDNLIHTWFLSVDFQLYLVSLVTLLTFKGRKHAALAALAMLSLLGCAIATWTVARLHLTPFTIVPFPHFSQMMSTINAYYVLPFYHAVCYFSGCMTSLIVADFAERKISKTLQLAGWCASACCGLFCVSVKFIWFSSPNPPSGGAELFVAFFDRLLWSFFIAWIILMCATGRGGTLNKFLCWKAFVPLSRLSYAVYLIHWLFLELMLHSSRERVYWSAFNQLTLSFAVLVWCFLLSFVVFIACEAPTGVLEKLLFRRWIEDGGTRKQEHQE